MVSDCDNLVFQNEMQRKYTSLDISVTATPCVSYTMLLWICFWQALPSTAITVIPNLMSSAKYDRLLIEKFFLPQSLACNVSVATKHIPYFPCGSLWIAVWLCCSAHSQMWSDHIPHDMNPESVFNTDTVSSILFLTFLSKMIM